MEPLYEVIEGPVNVGSLCYGPGDVIKLPPFQAQFYERMGRVKPYVREDEDKKKGR